ncbi:MULTISPECIES: ABC transporter permease [Allobacillus]|uniref:ABC transporter permease n=1 Tax=Allobacillus halotolerans TaxID=570278 RepID=A0ABS6GMI1_9BACI|nr:MULTISPECIES: ABC transporter permease [Allobacillus]MBU6079850.1 ABC transporter permease [Allobacillus halotolerans]TSJ67908.1 ABC transporter permease [Allobacillus sp. SKP2-8]
MRNSWKVAKWEIRRNLKSKSFLISLFLTPIIFAIFATVPTLLSDSGEDQDSEPAQTTVYLNDEIGVWDQLEPMLSEGGDLHWDVELTDESSDEMATTLEDETRSVYIHLDESALQSGTVDYYTSEEVPESFQYEVQLFEQPLRYIQLERTGLDESEIQTAMNPITFNQNEVTMEAGTDAGEAQSQGIEYFLQKFVPGVFAGLVLFSIAITGMMVFQSASEEKKEKVAEIILSSVTAGELMQGKIIGYFVLGILQVTVWIGMAAPVALALVDYPIIEYLLVPELLLFLLIAILGYLMFASIFVGLGATLEDSSSGSNFQGFVFMIPWLPFIFIGPVLTNPEGMLSQVLSYIPFTSPGIMILRLSILDEWPWVQIFISLAILIVSIWLLMKLAGKIFRIGILIYGKNATLPEIWKWLRS